MLIVSRKLGESLVINDNIEVFILEVQKDRIRIGIDAPKSVKILRKELFETEKSNREAVDSVVKIDLDDLSKVIKKKAL